MENGQVLHSSLYVEQIDKFAVSLKQLAKTFLKLEEKKQTFSEEEIDEIHCHEGEDDGIHPTHDEAHRTFLVLPPLPTYLLGDVNVVDEWHHDESQPALQPYQECEVQHDDYGEFRPLHLHVQLLFLFVYHIFL